MSQNHLNKPETAGRKFQARNEKTVQNNQELATPAKRRSTVFKTSTAGTIEVASNPRRTHSSGVIGKVLNTGRSAGCTTVMSCIAPLTTTAAKSVHGISGRIENTEARSDRQLNA